MDSDSENESMEGEVNEDKRDDKIKEPGASWGKAKFDYYFTDYVDKDYPSGLSRKEERLANLEQEEAQRIQRKLFSNLDSINLQPVIDYESDSDSQDLLEHIESQNKSVTADVKKVGQVKVPKSKVRFADQNKTKNHDEEDLEDEDVDSDDQDHDDDDDDEELDNEGDEEEDEDDVKDEQTDKRKRRPINMAIKKNRGLTPYKKKEYRNPRVKHKLKYKKAMTKRRRIVKEAQTEFYRYSGETTGIKTSTVKSIKLC